MKPELKGVRIIDKGPKPRFMDSDVYSKSGEIYSYNVYEQSFEALESHGLAHLFENEEDFIRKQSQWKEGGGKIGTEEIQGVAEPERLEIPQKA